MVWRVQREGGKEIERERESIVKISLVPRPFEGRRKGLVCTVCTIAHELLSQQTL